MTAAIVRAEYSEGGTIKTIAKKYASNVFHNMLPVKFRLTIPLLQHP